MNPKPALFTVAVLAACTQDPDTETDTGTTDTGTPPPTDTTPTPTPTPTPTDPCGDGVDNPYLFCFGELLPIGEVRPLLQIAVGDWDGGEVDIVVGTESGVSWLPGEGVGEFATALEDLAFGYIEEPVLGLAVADFDADGRPDIAASDLSTYARIARGDGAGGVTSESWTVGEGLGADLYVADLAGSGPAMDIASGSTSYGGVNQPDVGASVWVSTPDPLVVALARTSADHTTLVWANGTAIRSSPITTTPEGPPSEGAILEANLPQGVVDIAAFDDDQDGDEDLYLLLDDGALYRWGSDGADGWEDPWTTVTAYTFVPDPEATSLEVADLDVDGVLDLVVLAPHGIQFLRGLGEGRLFRTLAFEVPTQTLTDLALADVTGDGRPDVVVASSFGALVARNDP